MTARLTIPKMAVENEETMRAIVSFSLLSSLNTAGKHSDSSAKQSTCACRCTWSCSGVYMGAGVEDPLPFPAGELVPPDELFDKSLSPSSAQQLHFFL